MKLICKKCLEPCHLDTGDSSTIAYVCPFDPEGIEVNWEIDEGIKHYTGLISTTELIPPVNIVAYDDVNHPKHYTEGRKYETIEVIEDWKLDFCLGNALKYISRAGRKNDAVEDLKKAVWYIERRIKQLEGA